MKTADINKIYLKFHARLILGVVALTGFASSHLLLKYKSLEMNIRYPVAALISYLVFIALMFAWKTYLEGLPPVSELNVDEKVKSDVVSEKRRWYEYADLPLSADGWDDIAIAIMVIAVFVGLLYFSAYVVFEIPVLMVEIVLSSLATSIFVKSIKKADDDIFVFKVIRQTILQGMGLILIYWIIGLSLTHFYPEAQKFSDLFR